MSHFKDLEGKRHIFQFYLAKIDARAVKATEDRDFDLAELLGNVGSILREDIQVLDDEIADQEYDGD